MQLVLLGRSRKTCQNKKLTTVASNDENEKMKFYISQNSQFFSEWRNFLTKRSFKRHNEKTPNEKSSNEKSPNEKSPNERSPKEESSKLKK